MRSSEVTAGQDALAAQYNDLRKDAYGGSQLLAHQQTTPDLTLKVQNGIVFIGRTKIVYAGGNSPSFTAPSANPRIDLLTINSAGTLERTAGTEAASPSVPTYPRDKVVLAEVYNRVGQTSIKDADDTTNGYIQRDARPFLINPKTISQDAGEIYAAAGGSSNAFTLALDPAFTAYVEGMIVAFKANHDITGSATININGLGAKTLKKYVSQNLASGDIVNGQLVLLQYDGTNFQVLSDISDQATFTYGETIAAGDVLYLKDSDGKVYKASASAFRQSENLLNIIGVAIEAGVANDVKKIKVDGVITGLSLGAASSTIAETLDQSHAGDVSSEAIQADTSRPRQIFQTGDLVGNITKIEVGIWKNGTPTDNLIFELFEISPTDFTATTGAALATMTFANADVTGSVTFLSKAITAVSLKPRRMYAIQARRTATDNTNYWRWTYGSDSGYLRGQRTNLSNAILFSGAAFQFKTYYTEQRNYYLGDDAYLSDAGAIAIAAGTEQRRIGKILSSSSILFDDRPFLDQLFDKYTMNVADGSSGSYRFPVPRNTKKIILYGIGTATSQVINIVLYGIDGNTFLQQNDYYGVGGGGVGISASISSNVLTVARSSASSVGNLKAYYFR